MKFNPNIGFTPQEMQILKQVVDKYGDDLAGKQDKLTAGPNITISADNVISASPQGESFRTLVNTTLSEATAHIYIRSGTDVESFTANRVRVQIYVPPSEAVSNNNGYINFGTESTPTFPISFGSLTLVNKDYSSLVYCDMNARNGDYYPPFATIVVKTTENGLTGANEQLYIDRNFNLLTGITKIAIDLNSGTFPVGTRVIVDVIDVTT